MNLVSRIAVAARLLATGKLAPNAGFDGAQMQRRLMSWRAGGESINSLILQGGELQRARARQLVRTNPYAANAAASFTAHAVGCGIKPSSLVEDGALKDEIQRLWLAWTDEADADGLTDFYGLQAMAARAMFEAGECFFRFRPRRLEDPGSGPGQAPLTVPLQLQMLSSEHLPLGKCETLPHGNEIIFGIELDRNGRRVAYHFHRIHPGDVRQRGSGELVRVPADQVCHVFHPIAEGQIRGVPWVAPAMVRLWLLDQYDDAGRRSRRCSRASSRGPGGLPKVPAFFVHAGVKLNSIALEFTRSGPAAATISAIAQARHRSAPPRAARRPASPSAASASSRARSSAPAARSAT